MHKPRKIPVQETLLFISILTAVGGYLNAYSFYTHGSFTSLHTGNMAKMGISVFQGQWSEALMVLIPISGNIVGAFLAELLRRSCTTRHPLIWQKVSISSEIIALFIIGFLPVSLPNILINWFLSVNAGFQLSNFRSCEGTVHNTTICTGNLRTVGQYLCTAVITREKSAVTKLFRYAAAVFSFPIGAGLGGIATLKLGGYASWICCIGLAIILYLIQHSTDSQT